MAILGQGLQALGFVATAMFFFLSGYGLTASHQKGNQIKDFPRRTILPFYIIILVLTGLYSAFHLLMGNGVQFTEIIKSLTFGGTIIVFGWYLQVQLVYYLFFYFVYHYCRAERRIGAMICLHMLYLILCLIAGLPSLFYERTFAFVFGMVWCIKRPEIDTWLDKDAHAAILWLLSLALFAVLYISSMMIRYEFVTVTARGVSYFFFVTVVILFFRRVEVHNPITRFFGIVSLELYVMQGMAIKFFRSDYVYLDNPFVYILVSTATSILLACLLHPVIGYIYKACRTGLHTAECK